MIAPITVAIADDHQIVIDGIIALLDRHPRINVVITSTNATDMLTALKKQVADILLTDIMMPGMSGRELAKQVHHLYPSTRILALSMSGQGDVINEMINDADIAGYVLKNISKQELIVAIEKIAGGGFYFSEEVLSELKQFSSRQKENEAAQLTNREVELIRLIEKEYTNKQIAEALFISERTVETHRKNIFRKTQAGSLLGLIKYAYDHGIVKR